MQGPCQAPSAEQREGSCLPSWAQAAPGPAASIFTPAVMSNWEPRQIPAEEAEVDRLVRNQICSNLQARSYLACDLPLPCSMSGLLSRQVRAWGLSTTRKAARQKSIFIGHARLQRRCDSAHIVPETLYFPTTTQAWALSPHPT